MHRSALASSNKVYIKQAAAAADRQLSRHSDTSAGIADAVSQNCMIVVGIAFTRGGGVSWPPFPSSPRTQVNRKRTSVATRSAAIRAGDPRLLQPRIPLPLLVRC